MDRRSHGFKKLAGIAALLVGGCSPTQPYFLHEDGDLSHLVTKATDIEYPDVQSDPLPDAAEALEPYTLVNPESGDFWDISLEECVAISLNNSKVIRTIATVRQTQQIGQGVAGPPETLSLNADFTPTIYDVAIEEAGPNGVETALAAFDAQWNTNLFWERTDRPQNVNDATGGTQIFARILERDAMNFESELTKRSATGTQWSFRNVSTYDASNRPLRVQASEWLTSFEAEARHPLMRGSGTQVNRVPVMLARIRTDQSIIRFSNAVRDHVYSVERAYWDLYFFYRNLHTARIGRDTALGTWQRVNAMYEQGGPNVSGEQEAQSREQYYFFTGRLQEGKRDLLKAETRLRFLMGLAPTDGRVMRPTDNPTLARVEFSWDDIVVEALTRSPEIRQRKWAIKQREIEMMAARNNLLPQVDIVALYRWLGLGDDLWNDNRIGENFPEFDSTAFDELTEGRFQEWRVGFEVQVPLGGRAAFAGVRNSQLQLQREKARLEDIELELSHRLTDAIQNLDATYALSRSALMQRAAAERQVQVLENKEEFGAVTLDVLLDAQRRAADAERAFYQSVLQYNQAILEVHYAKGSLLEYNGIALEEGPWPAKAYFDALVRARQRDASYYFDYGVTRPRVISRGPVPQTTDELFMEAVGGSADPQPTLAEPIPPGAMDVEGNAVPAPEVLPAPGQPAEELRSAMRSALGLESSTATEGPVLNRPSPVLNRSSSAMSNKFEWDEAFE
jgi:outer membrane protein TolC